MQVIPLSPDANQEFTVRLADHRFTMRLKDTNGVMVADLTVDGAVLFLGSRVLAGEPIIPYDYLEAGNFMLLTDVEALPAWPEFGSTQFLVYLSPEEIAVL